MKPGIRVLLVDDHAIVRQGVRLLLEGQADMQVVGEAGDGGTAIEMISRLQPDVVLMDIAMPGINGLEATREIKKSWPGMQVIALTVHHNDEYFFQMITAGASGYVLKGADPAELLEAIRTAQKGEVFLHPLLTTTLVRDYLRRVRLGEASDSRDALSERELQVLRLIGEGYTTQEIAETLTITASTVQTHRAHIMDKLNLRKALRAYQVRRSARTHRLRRAVNQGPLACQALPRGSVFAIERITSFHDPLMMTRPVDPWRLSSGSGLHHEEAVAWRSPDALS